MYVVAVSWLSKGDSLICLQASRKRDFTDCPPLSGDCYLHEQKQTNVTIIAASGRPLPSPKCRPSFLLTYLKPRYSGVLCVNIWAARSSMTGHLDGILYQPRAGGFSSDRGSQLNQHVPENLLSLEIPTIQSAWSEHKGQPKAFESAIFSVTPNFIV